jgi:hypothetical protein
MVHLLIDLSVPPDVTGVNHTQIKSVLVHFCRAGHGCEAAFSSCARVQTKTLCPSDRGQQILPENLYTPRQAFSPYALRHLLSSAVILNKIPHRKAACQVFFAEFFIFFLYLLI